MCSARAMSQYSRDSSAKTFEESCMNALLKECSERRESTAEPIARPSGTCRPGLGKIP
jgi:hypothetical protein